MSDLDLYRYPLVFCPLFNPSFAVSVMYHGLDFNLLTFGSQMPHYSRYPVQVPETSPVLRGLRPLHLPYRSSLHPQLYCHNEPHPCHRFRMKGSLTYVFLYDPTPEGQAASMAYTLTANSMNNPDVLTPGEYVFLMTSHRHIHDPSRCQRLCPSSSW